MEKELTRNTFFLKAVILKYMMPSILSMIATTVSALIDTVIVAAFLGTDGLSAISLVSPVYLFYYTIGAVFGIGGASAASFYIGRNNFDGYRRVFFHASAALLFFAVVATVLGLIFIDPIASFLGGSGNSLLLLREYLRYYIPGGGLTLLAYIPLYFLKCEGKPQVSSWLILISSILNIALTYLFMSPLVGMGIGGASWATSISMGFTAVFGLLILLKNSREIRIKPCVLSWRIFKEILLAGAPSGLNNFCGALRMILFNFIVLRIGASAFLPSLTVVKNVSDLVIGIVLGVSSVLLSVTAVYFGERDNESVRSVFKTAIKLGFLIVLVCAVLVILLPDLISGIFNIREDALLIENRRALICLSISFLFAFFNIMLSGYFTTIKRVVLPNIIVAMRLLLCAIPAALVCTNNFGIFGLWLSFPIAEALSLMITFFLMAIIRKRNKCLDHYLLNIQGEGEKEISFSVKNQIDDLMFASNKIVDFCRENEINAKRTMQVSLALEEMLTVIITKCMDTAKEQFIDVRIKLIKEEVMIRIRNSGKRFDPVSYYEENKDNEEMEDELLGIRIIMKSASCVDFRETFSVNNLLIIF